MIQTIVHVNAGDNLVYIRILVFQLIQL